MQEQEEQSKDIKDYLVAVRKRKSAIFIIFSVVLVLAIMVALLLPAIYESGSKILIERQEIPQELVMSTVTSYASETIQIIQARVMTRTNLLRIIDEFKLYENKRKFKTTEELVGQMREDVSLKIISADVVDPRTGRPSLATIAFSLSYTGESPSSVQRVANELTSLYLEANLSSRTQKAAETSEFFTEEIERLGSQIEKIENRLADFKEKNAKSLPELQQLNMGVLQRKENGLIALDSKMIVLEEKSFYLDSQLAQIEPGNPDIPGSVERLKLLLAKYATAISKYSDEHPDVVRLKSEIESLENETGKANSSDQIAQQLKTLNGELAQKKETYTAEHPDIISLDEKIQALNIKLSEAINTPEEDYFDEIPDNPLYVSVKAQLISTKSELQAVKLEREKLITDINELEQSLYLTPQVERGYLGLKRNYANAVVRYKETKAKQMQAEIAEQLESESKGERFTLIEPAAFPEKPISPNRQAIVFLGFVFALVSGVGFAVLADVISGSVRGAKSIYGLIGALPLSVIPYELNLQEKVKTKRIKKRIVILFFAIILFAFLFVHFVISPLDVLWFRILRKIDILMA